MRRWLIALLTLAALLSMAAAVLAQDETGVTDDQVLEVARSLYCPICPNEPLDTCQTQTCVRWREDIRSQLEAGMTKDEIIAAFVARYGERASAVPLNPVLNALSTVTPYVIAGAGLIIGLWLISRWRAGRKTALPPVAPPPDGSDDAYRALLEEDVNR